MYRKFWNVPIFKDIPPICPDFLGFRVGKYELLSVSNILEIADMQTIMSGRDTWRGIVYSISDASAK